MSLQQQSDTAGAALATTAAQAAAQAAAQDETNCRNITINYKEQIWKPPLDSNPKKGYLAMAIDRSAASFNDSCKDFGRGEPRLGKIKTFFAKVLSKKWRKKVAKRI